MALAAVFAVHVSSLALTFFSLKLASIKLIKPITFSS